MIWREIFNSLDVEFSKSGVEAADYLQIWRERIFRTFFLSALIVGSLNLVTSVKFAVENGYWFNTAIYVLAYSWVIVITFVRRIPYSLRAWSGISLFLGLGVLALFTLGPAGSGRPFFFVFAVTASLLLGLRAGLIALGLIFFFLALIGWRLKTGSITWPLLDFYSYDVWMTTSITFIVVCTLVSICLSMLVGGLDQVIRRQKAASAELREANARLAREIAARKRAEEDLLTYQKYLRDMSTRISLAEERERRRIAVDLHDNIGQELAFCKIKLSGYRCTGAAPMEEVYGEMLTVCDRLIQKTRSLTQELSPVILYELGLGEALEWLCDQYQHEYGTDIRFKDTGGGTLQKDIAVQVVVFRAVRELLTNVIKHAGASRALVSLTVEKDAIRVEVEDNGIGFDANRMCSDNRFTSCFGLFSVRESLESMSGEFLVTSKPGSGTKMSLIMPQIMEGMIP